MTDEHKATTSPLGTLLTERAALREALAHCAAILQGDGPHETCAYLIDGRRVTVKAAIDAADRALGMNAATDAAYAALFARQGGAVE